MEKLTREQVQLVCLTYFKWRAMKNRCYLKTDQRYSAYGERGIKVCDEWLDKQEGFLNFFEYISQLPHFGENGYSLDRIDNDGNYEPGNVRFATRAVQANNRRCVHVDNGQTLSEIAKQIHITAKSLRNRWRKGDRGEQLRRALNVIVEHGQTLKQMAEETGIPIGTLRNRWYVGDRGDRLRRPVGTKKDAYSQELTRLETTD